MIDYIELIYFDLIKLITGMITPSIFNYFITNGHDSSLALFIDIMAGDDISSTEHINDSDIFSVIDFRSSTV